MGKPYWTIIEQLAQGGVHISNIQNLGLNESYDLVLKLFVMMLARWSDKDMNLVIAS